MGRVPGTGAEQHDGEPEEVAAVEAVGEEAEGEGAGARKKTQIQMGQWAAR
jgi:hypothetical protein